MPHQDEFLAMRPLWSGTIRARALGPPGEKWILHAGPPFADPADVPPPVANSLAAAIRFEGWAKDDAEARANLARGRIALHPAQDYGVVTPLAFPISPSMTLMRVGTAAAPFNEGAGTSCAWGRPRRRPANA